MHVQAIIFVLLGIFIVYRISMRVRRTIGWQQLQTGKLGTYTVILSIVGLIFFAEGLFHITSLLSNLIGIAAGCVLAYFSAATTRFEQRNGHWFYRSNVWVGGIVTVLFLGRLIYRVYDVYAQTQLPATSQGLSLSDRLQDMTGGWTSGLMLIMFAYYVSYNVILLRRQELRA